MYVNINCDVSTSPLPSVTLSCVRCHSEWALLTLSTAISKQKLWSNVSLGFLPGQRSFHGAILLFRLYFGRRCETRDSHCEGLGGCRNLNGSEHEQILRKVFDTTVLCNMTCYVDQTSIILHEFPQLWRPWIWNSYVMQILDDLVKRVQSCSELA